jgi:dipeptidyl aminopeptidase/acylaminoacyl peptidase
MSDTLERRLAARLREVAATVPDDADPPVDLDARVERCRRGRRVRAASFSLALAATVVAVIGVAAALTESREASVDVAVTDPRSRIGQIKREVVLLDARGRYVVALDAGGHQVDTLVVVNDGIVVDAQATANRTTLWYAAKPSADAPCARIVRADVGTGIASPVAEAAAFAVSPDGSRLAFAAGVGGACPDATGAHQVVVRDLARGSSTRWETAVGSVSSLRWSLDGSAIAVSYRDGDESRVAVVEIPSQLERGTRVRTVESGRAGVFGDDGLYVIDDQAGSVRIVRHDTEAATAAVVLDTFETSRWSVSQVVPVGRAVYAVARAGDAPTGLYRLSARSRELVRTFDWGVLTAVRPPG